MIFHEGERADGVYVLCDGAVKLFQSNGSGRSLIVDVSAPGEVLGGLPSDPEEGYAVSAEALEASRVCYLPREALPRMIQFNPMFGVRLIEALSRAMASARWKARDLALKTADRRLAELLVRLVAKENGDGTTGAVQIEPSYSRRDLAEMIGVSTETAIRLLGSLKRRGVIDPNGRKLVVADPAALFRVAGQKQIAGR